MHTLTGNDAPTLILSVRQHRTGRADARLMRDLVAGGRLPERWIPPSHVPECRARLELYHDLRAGHTAWVQRVHVVLVPSGRPGVP